MRFPDFSVLVVFMDSSVLQVRCGSPGPAPVWRYMDESLAFCRDSSGRAEVRQQWLQVLVPPGQ